MSVRSSKSGFAEDMYALYSFLFGLSLKLLFLLLVMMGSYFSCSDHFPKIKC